MTQQLIIMRGLPGSGKSYAAKSHYGIVCSTDDFFMFEGVYRFNRQAIPEAHKWNQERVKSLMQSGTSPIIVDNTNIRLWEMKPYILLARENGYSVSFGYPETPWANDPAECFKRNSHGVPEETIVRMHNSFEHFRTVEEILNA